jgi:hypothetical protein
MVKEMYPLHCCLPREISGVTQGFHSRETEVMAFWVIVLYKLVDENQYFRGHATSIFRVEIHELGDVLLPTHRGS